MIKPAYIFLIIVCLSFLRGETIAQEALYQNDTFSQVLSGQAVSTLFPTDWTENPYMLQAKTKLF